MRQTTARKSTEKDPSDILPTRTSLRTAKSATSPASSHIQTQGLLALTGSCRKNADNIQFQPQQHVSADKPFEQESDRVILRSPPGLVQHCATNGHAKSRVTSPIDSLASTGGGAHGGLDTSTAPSSKSLPHELARNSRSHEFSYVVEDKGTGMQCGNRVSSPANAVKCIMRSDSLNQNECANVPAGKTVS